MSGIQILLLISTILIGIYFLVRVKKQVIDVLFLGSLVCSAIVFIIWPDLTNIIAHRLGVGRGADLIMYVSIILFWFILLKLYVRIRKLEQAFTKIIRSDALMKAKDFSTDNVDKAQ